MKKKVLIILLILVFLAGITSIIAVITKKNSNEEKETTKEITTEEVAETTTEATEEATTEAPVVEREDYEVAYMSVLKDKEYDFMLYDWKNNSEETDGIAVVDITGDETPELIVLYAGNNESAILEIYTCENDSAKQIFKMDYFDTQVGGSNSYVLYKSADSTDLKYYYVIGGESSDYKYGSFTMGDDGMLTMTDCFEKYTGPDGTWTTKNGENIGEDEYAALEQEALASMSVIVNYNYMATDVISDKLSTLDCQFMTYDKAIEALNNSLISAYGEAPKGSMREAYTNLIDDVLNGKFDYPFSDSFKQSEAFGYVLYDINYDGTKELLLGGRFNFDTFYGYDYYVFFFNEDGSLTMSDNDFMCYGGLWQPSDNNGLFYCSNFTKFDGETKISRVTLNGTTLSTEDYTSYVMSSSENEAFSSENILVESFDATDKSAVIVLK